MQNVNSFLQLSRFRPLERREKRVQASARVNEREALFSGKERGKRGKGVRHFRAEMELPVLQHVENAPKLGKGKRLCVGSAGEWQKLHEEKCRQQYGGSRTRNSRNTREMEHPDGAHDSR